MNNEQIGRYKIKKELGRGGMATVFLAHDPRFGREVAVKVLPRQFTHDPQFRVRFEREARMIAALEHKAIVPVYDFGEEDDQPYLVMRYMPGGSLSDQLQDGPLPLTQVSAIITRIASALDRAHSMGIIHRDLKPGNILFDQYGDAFLADFGIAQMAEATIALTGDAVVGTPAYMSPEQVKGEKISGHSDIYTLGVILFEMLAGRQPYQADTPIGIAFKHVHDPVPYLPETKKSFPPNLELTVRQAMSKQSNARFDTASAMAARVVSDMQFHITSATEAIAPPSSVSPEPDNIPAPVTPKPLSKTEVLPEDELFERVTAAKPLPTETPIITKPPLQPALIEPVTHKTKRGVPLWVWAVTAVAVVTVLVWGIAGLIPDKSSGSTTANQPDSPASDMSVASFVQAKWEEEFRVTGLAYGDHVWAAMMSQDSPYGRQTWQTKKEFPGEFIDSKWEEEFRVTSLAYGNGVWGLMMSQDGPYGRQIWQTKKEFPGEFIDSKWDEEFRVTNLTYGNGVWGIVMSQGSPYGRQIWQTKKDFPSAFIESKWEEGFRVTSLAYGNGLWGVVMSQGSPYGRQIWQTKKEFPGEFIESEWEAGFRVTDLTYGNGVWGVVMSQGTPYGRQTWQTTQDFTQ